MPSPEEPRRDAASDDDRSRVAAFLRGEVEAGEQLIERHYDAVVRFFRTKAPQAVDDLVQKTFLVTMERLGSYEGRASFRAFVLGIARNVLFEHLRGRYRDGRGGAAIGQSSILDLAPGVFTLAHRRAEERRLVAALHAIPLDLQLLVELHYWEELGVDELAVLLEVPEGTVKSRLFRARRALAEVLARGDQELAPDESTLDAWATRMRALRPDA